MDVSTHVCMDEFEQGRKSSGQRLATSEGKPKKIANKLISSAPRARFNSYDETQRNRCETPCDEATKTSDTRIDREGSSARRSSDTGLTSMDSWSEEGSQESKVSSSEVAWKMS